MPVAVDFSPRKTYPAGFVAERRLPFHLGEDSLIPCPGN